MQENFQISILFWWNEVIKSQTASRNGINNTPGLKEFTNIVRHATLMDEVRTLFKHPIIPSSWYRCPEINKMVGGSSASKHMDGRATDFDCDQWGTPLRMFNLLVESNIQFDRLILEYDDWLHMESAMIGIKPRRLLCRKVAGQKGLIDLDGPIKQ